MPQLPDFGSRQPYGFTPLPMRTTSPDALALAATEKAGAVLTETMDRINEAHQVTALNSARNDWSMGVAKLRGELETEPDPTRIMSGWRDGTAQLRDQIGAKISDPQVRGAFGGAVAHDMAGHELDIVRLTSKRSAEAGQASLDAMISSSVREAAAAPNDLVRRTVDARVEQGISGALLAGQISAVDAEKRRSHYVSQLDEAGVRNLLTAAPDQAVRALADATRFPNLQPERRAAMLDMATRRADAAADRAIRQAELAERQAERNGKREADRHANDMWVQIAKAERGEAEFPTLDDVGKWRGFLSPGETAALTNRLRRTDAASDDPETVRQLTVGLDRMEEGEFSEAAGRALKAGRLKSDTFRTLVNQNRAARKDDQPASPYRSGRGFVHGALDPGNVVGGNFIRGPLATAQQRALADYDTWATANPTAPREQALAKAQDLVDQYSLQASTESRITIGRPWGYRGGQDGITLETVRAAGRQLQADLQSGKVGDSELVRETERLEAWKHLLEQADKRGVGSPRTPASSGRGAVKAQ